MKRTKQAFTLVELVITIAIVIVLSSISYPIYKDHLGKAKMAEGYTLLAQIRDAQINYYNEYGTFLHSKDSSSGTNYWTNNEEVLGINARGNKYFSWFAVGWGASVNNFTANAYEPPEIHAGGYRLYLRYYISTGGVYSEGY